jgi:hypothetical protein
VICVRLDATVVTAHSDKEGAEPNYKGSGTTRWPAWCDTGRRRRAKITAILALGRCHRERMDRITALPQAPDQQGSRPCDQERNLGHVEPRPPGPQPGPVISAR